MKIFLPILLGVGLLYLAFMAVFMVYLFATVIIEKIKKRKQANEKIKKISK